MKTLDELLEERNLPRSKGDEDLQVTPVPHTTDLEIALLSCAVVGLIALIVGTAR